MKINGGQRLPALPSNAHFHDQIRQICGIMGYEMVKICTPNELLEDQSDVS